MNPRIYKSPNDIMKPILLKLEINSGIVELYAVNGEGEHIILIAFIDEDGMNMSIGAEKELRSRGYDTSVWSWNEQGALMYYKDF